MRSQERFLHYAWMYAMAAHDPQFGLSALKNTTEEWLGDFQYIGSRQLLEAQLNELAGKKELAHLNYEPALEVLNRNRDESPNGRWNTYQLETWIYLGLGRLEDARKSLLILMESIPRPYQSWIFGIYWFDPILVSLLMGEKVSALVLMREATGRFGDPANLQSPYARNARASLRVQFKLDPRLQAWRDDPEIRALIDEPSPAN